MADLRREEMRRLARIGASARLEELRREEASIRAAFPDLFRGRGAGPRATASDAAPRRRNISAAGRRAISERMTRYWAERRKQKAKAQGKK